MATKKEQRRERANHPRKRWSTPSFLCDRVQLRRRITKKGAPGRRYESSSRVSERIIDAASVRPRATVFFIFSDVWGNIKKWSAWQKDFGKEKIKPIDTCKSLSRAHIFRTCVITPWYDASTENPKKNSVKHIYLTAATDCIEYLSLPTKKGRFDWCSSASKTKQ
jgi:hypothetical protein